MKINVTLKRATAVVVKAVATQVRLLLLLQYATAKGCTTAAVYDASERHMIYIYDENSSSRCLASISRHCVEQAGCLRRLYSSSVNGSIQILYDMLHVHVYDFHVIQVQAGLVRRRRVWGLYKYKCYMIHTAAVGKRQ